MNADLDEAAVRALRDRVFEKPSTDGNWFHCREAWMRPDSVAWLQRNATALEAKEAKR